MDLDVIQWESLDESARTAALARPALAHDTERRAVVNQILAQVRAQGDAALRAFGRQFDGVALESLFVSDAEFRAAEDSLPAEAIAAIDAAIENVNAFHSAQRPSAVRVETTPGVICERIVQPLDAVGLYVPAGSAPLPSTAIMLAVPARLAGCPQRVLCSPPRSDGTADPAVLVAARRCGVGTVLKLGGAQAIAALAYGTESVPKVVKIFGPGNAWVTTAKTLVAMEASGPAIDMPAGPSEVLVIADEDAQPEFVAADLLSQAEHGEDSQVVLVATSAAVLVAAISAVKRQLETLGRRDIARRAMTAARFILARDLSSAIAISNRYAPEHLILQIRNARAALSEVRNAGSVFLGTWSPEAVGDYCSGTNHVLPTYGAARAYSGLSLSAFQRHMTVQELTQEGLTRLAPTVLALADLEGLDAHAAAVRCRTAANESAA